MSKYPPHTSKDNRMFNFKKILTEKVAFMNLVIISLLLNALVLVCVLILQKSLPPQIPLFYGLAEGEEQLTTSLGLLIPGGLAISLVLFNFSISLFLENKFLQKTLSATSFTVSLLSTITVVKIILLVGNI